MVSAPKHAVGCGGWVVPGPPPALVMMASSSAEPQPNAGEGGDPSLKDALLGGGGERSRASTGGSRTGIRLTVDAENQDGSLDHDGSAGADASESHRQQPSKPRSQLSLRSTDSSQGLGAEASANISRTPSRSGSITSEYVLIFAPGVCLASAPAKSHMSAGPDRLGRSISPACNHSLLVGHYNTCPGPYRTLLALVILIPHLRSHQISHRRQHPGDGTGPAALGKL